MSYLLHMLLQKSAELYPEKTAVRYKNEEISYKILDILSDQLGSSLINKDVQIGDRVGIYIDKSIDAVIAIFGVLKSGACYVPLDPMAPPQRQLLIINNCSLEYLIASSKKLFQILPMLQNKSNLKYIFIIDAGKEEVKENMPEVNIIFKEKIFTAENNIKQQTKQIGDNNLAYILYTSGSTGQPKGVMITHKASLAFVNWANKYFGICDDEKISSVSPFHFDLSIFDIFVTIKSGSTMCIIPQGMCGFPQSLAKFIESEKITTWYSVPSILIQLILYGELEKKDLSVLRRIIFAGEVFPGKYLRELMQLVPVAHFYNLYGPTETNVCTVYPIEKMPEPEKAMPIGRACEGTEVFVCDTAGRFVKNGEIGELYVSGATLMEGYWNDPQKTKSVLLKNFLPKHKCQKVYKTGDMVRFNEEDNLEFHGRRDGMIKSMGYRIELGEIEAVLYEHPLIKEVVAVAVPTEEMGNKIKAVIVLEDGSSTTEAEIKNFCSKKLPIYMIPKAITFNNYIPKTSTGKVDREKLETLGLLWTKLMKNSIFF